MAEPNPFLHPARQRFLELLNEVEHQAQVQEEEQGTLADPLQPFHRAEEWGIDPWVAAMQPVDQEILKLQTAAKSLDPRDDEAAVSDAFLRIAVGALHARVLFEEGQADDPLQLDDQDLANFLDKLKDNLGDRVERLRRGPSVSEPEKVEVPILGLEEQRAMVDDQIDENTGPLDVNRFIASQTDDEDAGDEHDGWLNHGGVQNHSHDERRGRHVHDGWNLVTWEGDIPPATQRDLSPASDPDRRPVADPAPTMTYEEAMTHPIGEDTGSMGPVDLEAAERALAREMTALKQTAIGSSAVRLGGRHASPERTDPSLGDQGKH